MALFSPSTGLSIHVCLFVHMHLHHKQESNHPKGEPVPSLFDALWSSPRVNADNEDGFFTPISLETSTPMWWLAHVQAWLRREQKTLPPKRGGIIV